MNVFAIFFAYSLFAFHMFWDTLIFHGVKEGQALEIACLEHVVCTCNG